VSAIPEAINKVTIAFHKLRTAVDECDQSRRLPAVVPEPLKTIAEDACMNAEACDLEIAIRLIDQAARICYVRAEQIQRLTREINKQKAKP
jgi:hypothetical protein